MTNIRIGFKVLSGLASAVIIACTAAQTDRTPVVAFTNASVVDVVGGATRHDVTLVVRGNRITAVGESKSTPLPPNSRVIDASGKFVIPGLWDMHVHTLQTWTVGDKTADIHDTFFPLFVANGITGVRDMNGSAAVLRRVRARMETGQMRGPRIVAAGLMVDGARWSFGSIPVASTEDGRNAVGQLVEAGAEFVKIGGLTPRNAYFGITETAKVRGLPFAGHVPFQITASEASAAGQKSIEHLDGVLLGCSSEEADLRQSAQAMIKGEGALAYLWLARVRAESRALETTDVDRCSTLISQFVANETWHVPTLVLKRATAFLDDQSVVEDPGTAYIPRYLLETWGPDNGLTGKYSPEDFENDKRVFARHLELVGTMHRAGVQLMAGTDTVDPYIFPGFSVHDEMELFVKAGLTPLQALQTATRNPARYLGRTDLGAVAVGMAADLVFLGADPQEDIRNTRNIWAVVLNGEVLDQVTIASMLRVSKELAASGARQD